MTAPSRAGPILGVMALIIAGVALVRAERAYAMKLRSNRAWGFITPGDLSRLMIDPAGPPAAEGA